MGTNDDGKYSVLGCGFPLRVSIEISSLAGKQLSQYARRYCWEPRDGFPLEVALRFVKKLGCWESVI